MRHTAFTAFVVMILLATMHGTLAAHEKGAIVLSTKAAGPGDTVMVNGSKLGRNASVRLELRGALSTFSFGRFYADTAGGLRQQLTIPANTQPGQYTIAAVAADGDVSAQADLMIGSSGTGTVSPGMQAMPGMGQMPGMSGPHATAEKMKVPVSITPAGRAVIWSVVLLSGLAGALLLRGTRPTTEP